MKEKTILSEEILNKLFLEGVYQVIEKQYQKKLNNYIDKLELKNKIIFKLTNEGCFDIFATTNDNVTFKICFSKSSIEFIMKIAKELGNVYTKQNLFKEEDNVFNFIFAVIIDFIFHHEFTHIVRGHFIEDRESFFDTFSNIDLLEEVDTDFYATLFTIVFAEQKKKHFKSNNEILYHTTIFQSIIKFFNEVNLLNPNAKRESHPLPLERIIYFNNLYLFAIEYKKGLIKDLEGLKKSFLINLYSLIKDNPKYNFNKKEIDNLWLEYSDLTKHIDFDLLRI